MFAQNLEYEGFSFTSPEKDGLWIIAINHGLNLNCGVWIGCDDSHGNRSVSVGVEN